MLKILRLFTAVLGWLQIVASPTIIGLVVGAIIYLYDRTTTRLYIGASIALIGFIVGLIWATKVWKTKGTVSFMSRVMATPELDKEDDKE